MDNRVIHSAIAEIYKSADKIKDMANCWADSGMETPEYEAILNLCIHIQLVDKIMHDNIFPNARKS